MRYGYLKICKKRCPGTRFRPGTTFGPWTLGTSEKLVLGTIFKRIYVVLRTFDVFDLVLIVRISPNSDHHLKAMVLLYHFLA